MKRPKMILFDYGHTLVYEPKQDYIAGAEKVLEHAISNPHMITTKQLNQMGASMFDEQANIIRKNCLEVMGLQLNTLIYELLGLKFDIEPLNLEYESWVASETIFPMEGIGELLLFLNDQRIRTGVVSNLAYSGITLKRRINDVLPMNKFEFVISSSDYLYRKPSRYIFDLAIEKAQLKPDEIWFCGDDIICDVEGSCNSGMFPVWYESALMCTYKKHVERKPNCENLHIREWKKLISILNGYVF